MNTDTIHEGLACREWGTKPFDGFLVRDVPPDRVAEFQSRLRPLTDALAEAVRDRLFRGTGRPFHFRLATGWLGDAIRLDAGKARTLPVDRVGELLGWADDAVTLLVYHTTTHDVLAGRWGWVRECLLADWLDTWSNVVICSDSSRWALVYWEGGGPRCVSRGDRRLLPHP
jgi:hypothetical protein